MATNDGKEETRDESQQTGHIDFTNSNVENGNALDTANQERQQLVQRGRGMESNITTQRNDEAREERKREENFLRTNEPVHGQQSLRRTSTITRANYHKVEKRIKELQRTMTFKTTAVKKQLKPKVAQLQRELAKWKRENNIGVSLGSNSKKRRNPEPGKITLPPPNSPKRAHILHERANPNFNNNNNNNSNTESISSRNSITHSAAARLEDQIQLLNAKIDSLTAQNDVNLSGLSRLSPIQNDVFTNENNRPSFTPQSEKLSFKHVFTRPTLFRFSSTCQSFGNAHTQDTNTRVNTNNVVDTENTSTDAKVSDEEKLAIKKKANETKLNLALKLNFKFNNKASNKVIEALRFRNNVKNWERIGRSVLGWEDEVALLSVKMAFVDVQDFNDFEIKSAATMEEFYAWFDIKYNVASARQDLFYLITNWICPFDISLSGVIPKYLEDLDLFEGTSDTCGQEILALTPFTPVMAVNSVRNSLPKPWKIKLTHHEQIYQGFIDNLEDLHAAFVHIEQLMRRENLQKINDLNFIPNMIIYKDISRNQANNTANYVSNQFNFSNNRFRRGSWRSRNTNYRGNNYRGGRGNYNRGYENSWTGRTQFGPNRGNNFRGNRRGRGRGGRSRGRFRNNNNFQNQYQYYNNQFNSNSTTARVPVILINNVLTVNWADIWQNHMQYWHYHKILKK